jgi:hypothetical protein
MNDKIDLSHGWRVGALVAAVTILTFSIDAHAQDDGWQRGSGAGKQPNASTAGDFAVVQLATTEPDKLMADWNKPTPGVSMVTNTRATRNQPIVTFIIFKGCRADAAGNCNVTVDYDTLGPDGKTYDETKAAEVWVGHPPSARPQPTALGIRVRPTYRRQRPVGHLSGPRGDHRSRSRRHAEHRAVSDHRDEVARDQIFAFGHDAAGRFSAQADSKLPFLGR